MRKWLIPVLAMAALAACGETRGQRATTGALGGGIAGAVVGGPVGAVVGAGVGAAGGAYRERVDAGTDAAAGKAGTAIARTYRDTVGPEQAAAAPAPGTPREADVARSAERVGGPSNEEVRQAQTVLRDLGLYDGQIDGLYGRKTIRAVGQFQEENDLARTMTLNAPTQARLQQVASTAGQGAGQQGQPPSMQSPGQAPEAPPPAAQPPAPQQDRGTETPTTPQNR